MLQRILTLFLAAFLPIAGALAADTPNVVPGVEIVDATKAKDLIAKGIKYYDVRVTSDFAEGHIKGAIGLPYTNVSDNKPDFDGGKDTWAIGKLPADKSEPILIYGNGPSGWRHYKAAVLAVKAGHKKVYWMRGGIDEWKAKGNALE